MYKSFKAATMVAVVALLACIGQGCSNPADAHRVDSDVALEVLVDVLQSWKDGERPEGCQAKTPPVVVQDLDWIRGIKLTEFQIQDGAQSIDANLHCQVKLDLLDENQVKSQKTVVYLVGTSPTRTVFRSLSP